MNMPPPTASQARILWLALTGVAVAVIVGLVVLLVWGLSRVLAVLGPVIWPIAVAAVVAYLLDPVVDFLERRRVPRARAILGVFAIAFFLVLAVLSSVIPQVVVETSDLVQRVPTYVARVHQRAGEWVAHPPRLVREWVLPWVGTHSPADSSAHDPAASNAPPAAAATEPAAVTSTNTPPPGASDLSHWLASTFTPQTVQSATSWLSRVATSVSSWLFGQVMKVASWLGVVAALMLIPIYSFYFLLEKQKIATKWSQYLPLADSRFKTELVFVLSSINEYLITFFRGQVLVAVCDGVMYTLGFLAIGLPYAVLIGAMATVLTIVPYLGAIATCGTALLVAVLQFGDLLHPLLVLAVFGVVQTIEGFLIAPKIIGDRVGLHPVTIIIALMIGTTLLGGVLGAILAIPFTAALRVVLGRYVWRRDVTGAESAAPRPALGPIESRTP